MDAGRCTADDLGELQVRVLGAVATRWTGVPGTVAGALVRTDAQALGDLAAGLAALLAAVGPSAAGPGGLPATVPGPGGVPEAGAVQARWMLGCAAEALALVAEVARRVSASVCAVGAGAAADYADGVMTVAVALRMLVELERDALPRP